MMFVRRGFQVLIFHILLFVALSLFSSTARASFYLLCMSSAGASLVLYRAIRNYLDYLDEKPMFETRFISFWFTVSLNLVSLRLFLSRFNILVFLIGVGCFGLCYIALGYRDFTCNIVKPDNIKGNFDKLIALLHFILSSVLDVVSILVASVLIAISYPDIAKQALNTFIAIGAICGVWIMTSSNSSGPSISTLWSCLVKRL